MSRVLFRVLYRVLSRVLSRVLLSKNDINAYIKFTETSLLKLSHNYNKFFWIFTNVGLHWYLTFLGYLTRPQVVNITSPVTRSALRRSTRSRLSVAQPIKEVDEEDEDVVIEEYTPTPTTPATPTRKTVKPHVTSATKSNVRIARRNRVADIAKMFEDSVSIEEPTSVCNYNTVIL